MKKWFENFESIDYEIFRSVTKKLINTLTSDELIEYMGQFNETYGVTRQAYNEICEMLASGEIRLVDSAWKTDPDPMNYFGYPKKPNFINVENYIKINELRKDKRDWERNWRKYSEQYPVCDRFENKANFFMGEAYSRNMRMYINKSFLTEIELGKFQFMLVVFKDKERYSYDDYGQEYIFEFNGEDSKTKFVEYFRERICNYIAGRLIDKRREEIIEEESNKALILFGTIFDEKNEK